MTSEESSNSKTYLDYYWTKRSLEFIAGYDGEKEWHKLNGALRRKRLVRRLFYGSSVAAVVAVVFAVWYFSGNIQSDLRGEEYVQWQGGDESPESKGVVLLLSDGRRVDLNDLSGEVDSVHGMTNDRSGKQLVYRTDSERRGELQMNRLEVPQGAEYHLRLADGTRVWLNARSQLVYPVAFSDVREVKLEGEAYFEVARDEQHPFIVRTEGMAVRVLGTEFNVNARKEAGVQAVLVKGSVEVTAEGGDKVLLRPGELAETENGGIQVSEVNVRKYTAWHEGVFYFENATLEEIMRELSDWYCVQTIFVNPASRGRKFSGVLRRDDTVARVLRKIEQTTSVRFTLQQGIVKVE